MTQLSINTTQNVNINFTAASVGDRIFAQLLDILVMIAYAVVVGVLLDITGLSTTIEAMDTWSVMGAYVIIYSPIMFYTIVQESLWEGQTIGKRIMKTKVIKLDGYQAGFGDYLIRWLFRLVEILIGYGIIALIAVIASKKSQRLGDIVANTKMIKK